MGTNWPEDNPKKYLKFLKEIEKTLLIKFKYKRYFKFWIDNKNLLRIKKWNKSGEFSYFCCLYFYFNEFKIVSGLRKILFGLEYDRRNVRYILKICICCVIDGNSKEINFFIHDPYNIKELNSIKEIIVKILNRTDEVVEQNTQIEHVANKIDYMLDSEGEFALSCSSSIKE